MDNELRDALRRVEPPDGFAERVMKRAAGPTSLPSAASAFAKATADKSSGRRSLRMFAAAALVIAIGGSAWYRAEERRREGEEAKRQVLQSLSIAGSKLRAVQMKINHEQER